MPKLPNADKAIIPLEKFTMYALSPDHPQGKHKARVFRAALGLTINEADFLRDEVKRLIQTAEATPQSPTQYGKRFVVDFTLTTDVGTATVRTALMIRKEEDFPRLTTCYVIEDTNQ